MTRANPTSDDEVLAALQIELVKIQEALAREESELAERRRAIYTFENKVETRLGELMRQLEEVEGEVGEYMKIIEEHRNERLFGKDHGFKDPRYWRNWQGVSADESGRPVEPQEADVEAEVKDLYRQLARRLHPDLAEDEAERAYRTEKMAELNEAFQARNLAVLKMMSLEARIPLTPRPRTSGDRKPRDPVKAMEYELARCRWRMRAIRAEMNSLHLDPSVQLSLDVKLARRQGRDLLAEMAVDLRAKIARKVAERDYLKSQLDQLDPGS